MEKPFVHITHYIRTREPYDHQKWGEGGWGLHGDERSLRTLQYFIEQTTIYHTYLMFYCNAGLDTHSVNN